MQARGYRTGNCKELVSKVSPSRNEYDKGESFFQAFLTSRLPYYGETFNFGFSLSYLGKNGRHLYTEKPPLLKQPHRCQRIRVGTLGNTSEAVKT